MNIKDYEFRTFVMKNKTLSICYTLTVFFIICCMGISHATDEHTITLAVSPFKNLMKNPDLDWMSEGFAETLTTKLNHVSRLKLVERTQLEEIVDEMKLGMAGITEADATNIGKLLSADYLVIGSFQKIDAAGRSMIKINSRLVCVKTGEIEKGKAVSANGPYETVFDIQETIAAKLAKNLGLGLSDKELQNMGIDETLSVTAYELYHQAKNETDDARKEILLQKALEYDPAYAKAHLLLGSFYHVRATADSSLEPVSISHLEQAIKLDTTLYEAHYALGDYYYRKRDLYRSQKDKMEDEAIEKARYHFKTFVEGKKDSKAKYYIWKVKKAQKKLKKLG